LSLRYLLDPYARGGEKGVLTPRRRFDENSTLQQPESVRMLSARLDKGLGNALRMVFPHLFGQPQTQTQCWRAYGVYDVHSDFAFVSSSSICGDDHFHIYFCFRFYVHGYNFIDFVDFGSSSHHHPIIGTRASIRICTQTLVRTLLDIALDLAAASSTSLSNPTEQAGQSVFEDGDVCSFWEAGFQNAA
jgi:hypothetical protein